jgi:hypothetical protein
MLPTTDWRERTKFLDKRLLYAFSLELRTSIDLGLTAQSGARIRTRPAPARALGNPKGKARAVSPPVDHSDTYHVLNDQLIVSVDGATHEVPLTKVVDHQDVLTDVGGGVFDLNGRARLVTDDQASISMLYTGVVRLGFDGELVFTEPDQQATGSVQLAIQCEADRPKYRWLSQAQLIAFGEARTRTVASEKILSLSLDLYSAG